MIGTAHAYTDQYARIVTSVRRVSANDNAPLLVRTGPWESYLLSEPMRQFVQQAGPAATLSCNSNSYRILQERMSSKDLSLAFCDDPHSNASVGISASTRALPLQSSIDTFRPPSPEPLSSPFFG